MIGELASFFNALSNALTNTLGGKSTQTTSWRNTLRASASIAMVLISIAILFNLESITLKAVMIGMSAGVVGGLGLPFIYQAFAIGSVSFISPIVALVQSFNLILFAVVVENEQLSLSFPFAAALGVAGLFACSRTSSVNGLVNFKVFALTAAAAYFFTGFSLILTLIEPSSIVAAIFGSRIGVLIISFIFSPSREKISIKEKISDKEKTGDKSWRKYALLSGSAEISANLTYMLAISNLDLSKVGIFMASAPALAALIGIKLMKQKPSFINWLGIAATSGALIVIAIS